MLGKVDFGDALLSSLGFLLSLPRYAQTCFLFSLRLYRVITKRLYRQNGHHCKVFYIIFNISIASMN